MKRLTSFGCACVKKHLSGVKLCIYRRKPDEEQHKVIREKYPLIENVPNLMVPQTDREVYENMDKGAQIADQAVQHSQRLQAHALSAILRVLNAIGHGNAGMTHEHTRLLTDATRLISGSFTSGHQIRRDIIRNSMGWPLARLCDWRTPVGTETLFPDLNRKLSENDTTRTKLKRFNKYK